MGEGFTPALLTRQKLPTTAFPVTSSSWSTKLVLSATARRRLVVPTFCCLPTGLGRVNKRKGVPTTSSETSLGSGRSPVQAIVRSLVPRLI